MANTYQLFRQHLKSKRKLLGISLQILSERTGVSKSLISKIERSEVQPSIKTASNIAQGLGMSLSDMFQDSANEQVIFHPVAEQFMLNGDGQHTRKRVSPKTNDTCVEIYNDQLKASSTTDALLHKDANTFILAMDDGLSIIANEVKYTLNKGDCLYISHVVSHKIENTGSDEISFITMLHRL